MPRVTPCLWFDGVAAEAARYYTSLLPGSHVGRTMLAPADTPSGPAGSVLTVEFTLAGQPFTALDGGPDFQFSEAVSFVIDCEDQAEIDRLWTTLIADGGEAGPCGWLKDRYGLSWQIVPAELDGLLGGPDPVAARRTMEALLGMQKLDIAALRAAYHGNVADHSRA